MPAMSFAAWYSLWETREMLSSLISIWCSNFTNMSEITGVCQKWRHSIMPFPSMLLHALSFITRYASFLSLSSMPFDFSRRVAASLVVFSRRRWVGFHTNAKAFHSQRDSMRDIHHHWFIFTPDIIIIRHAGVILLFLEHIWRAQKYFPFAMIFKMLIFLFPLLIILWFITLLLLRLR